MRLVGEAFGSGAIRPILPGVFDQINRRRAKTADAGELFRRQTRREAIIAFKLPLAQTDFPGCFRNFRQAFDFNKNARRSS